MKTSGYFPVFKFTPASSALPFNINTIQQARDEMREEYDKSYSYDYFRITWILSGRGSLFIDLAKYDFKDNRAICIKPNQVHKLNLSDSAEGYVISFTEQFLNITELEFDLTCQANLFQLFEKKSGIKISNEILSDLKEIVDKMVKEFNNLYLFKADVLKRYLKIFLIYLTRQFDENFRSVIQSRNMEIVQNFMRLIERDFKRKKMVNDYADELCVTPNYLNEVIKKVTGYSAGYQIRQRVVLEAKQIALYSGASMKEIAYELGFLDPSHFSKFFKSVTGKNFSDFKKERVTLEIAV